MSTRKQDNRQQYELIQKIFVPDKDIIYSHIAAINSLVATRQISVEGKEAFYSGNHSDYFKEIGLIDASGHTTKNTEGLAKILIGRVSKIYKIE